MGKKKKKDVIEEEDEDEDESSDDDGDEGKSEDLSKKVSKKPRASAPPKMLSSEGIENKETNALVELHRGAALLKYPRRSGFPHFKHIQLSEDNLRVEWFSKRKKLSATCIQVKDIREVVRGQETEVFKKFHQKTLEKSSFSVVYGASYKTLDLAAKCIDEAEMWVSCLLRLVEVYRQHKREEDLIALKEIERDMDALNKAYAKTSALAAKSVITESN